MFKKTLLSKGRKNRIYIDYAPHHKKYYHRKKRSARSIFIKWLPLCIVAILAALYITPIQAETTTNYTTLAGVGSGQLLFESTEIIKKSTQEVPLYQPALLLNSAATLNINGILATVTVTQSFLNTSDTVIDGLYTFPLPENSAVNYLKVQIGNREIEGKIIEKAEAKKQFEQAKASGKKASLIEQHRPNLFTNNIANIGANEQITVTLTYVQHVDYSDGIFSLRFPMHITPRYTPANTSQNEYEINHSIKNNNAKVSKLTQHSTVNKNTIHLSVNLHAGMSLKKVESASHAIALNHNKLTGEPIKITVGNVQIPMDKNFVLMWQPTPSDAPTLSLYNQTLAGEEYTLAMLLPPTIKAENNTHKVTPAFARDITFIIDTSGSMQGESIKQAKQSLRFALNTLSPQDSFNIIAFASNTRSLFNTTQMFTSQRLTQALHFIDTLSANGGTAMYQPLSQALSMPQADEQHSEAIRQILFITDGAVSNEHELFTLIKHTKNLPRLFTVGIGSAPNGYFMRKAAQFGQGSYTFIGNIQHVKEKMSDLLNKISQPALTNIQVQFHPIHVGTIEQYPQKIPDLYRNEPLIISFKTSQKPTSIQLFGDLANQSWQQEINLSATPHIKPAHSTQQQEKQAHNITSIWARAKIEDLLDGLITGRASHLVKNDVISTSLKHQIMSPYTSFIAIEKSVEQDNIANKSEKEGTPKTAQLTQNSLHAAVFPKTALGWKAQLLLGIILLLISLVLLLCIKRKQTSLSTTHV